MSLRVEAAWLDFQRCRFAFTLVLFCFAPLVHGFAAGVLAFFIFNFFFLLPFLFILLGFFLFHFCGLSVELYFFVIFFFFLVFLPSCY